MFNLMMSSMSFILVTVLFLRFHLLSCLILLEMGTLLCVWMLLSGEGPVYYYIVVILVVGVVESCIGLSLLVYSSRFCSNENESF